MLQTDNRDRGDTELTRGFNAAMTSYDTVAIIDEHRIDEPKRPDAVRKLSNLLLRMRPSVSTGITQSFYVTNYNSRMHESIDLASICNHHFHVSGFRAPLVYVKQQGGK